MPKKNTDRKICAVIPARKGSKGLPGKNIRSFCGKPLIAHTIEAALESEVFSGIFVTSNDPKVIQIAEQYERVLPIWRPDSISKDDSLVSDAILHCLDAISDNYLFMLLQPTSPLRSAVHIREAVRCLDSSKKSLVSVCESAVAPNLLYTIEDRQLIKILDSSSWPLTNRQSFRKSYQINGAIYLTELGLYKKSLSFLNADTVPFVMSLESSIDIDSNFDFMAAEFYYSRDHSE